MLQIRRCANGISVFIAHRQSPPDKPIETFVSEHALLEWLREYEVGNDVIQSLLAQFRSVGRSELEFPEALPEEIEPAVSELGRHYTPEKFRFHLDRCEEVIKVCLQQQPAQINF